MGSNITNAMVDSYKGYLRLAAQNLESRLSDCVMVESGLEGRSATPVTLVQPITASKKTSRNTDTPITNVQFERRWYQPTAYELAELLDWDDAKKLSAEYDPKNGYLQSFVAALKRAQDDRILASFFAASKTGVDSDTGTTSFPSGNIVALNTGGTNSGLNVEKLKAAVEILAGNDVDPDEEMFCTITARQNKELLQDEEIVNALYRQEAVIKNGRLLSFMGINFKHVQFDDSVRYPDGQSALINGSSDYLIPLWVKSGMALGKWKDIEGKMDERPDKSYAIQVYACSMVGATRCEEEKVVQMITYGS